MDRLEKEGHKLMVAERNALLRITAENLGRRLGWQDSDAATEAYARLAKTWYRRLFEVYGISTFACRTRFGSYLRGTIVGKALWPYGQQARLVV